MLRNLSIAVSVFFLYACSQGHKDAGAIDFSEGKNLDKQINLSEVAESVEYIKLITPDSVLMSHDIEIDISKSYLLVMDNGTQNIFLFSRNGTYLNKISGKGNGPEEYADMSDAILDEENGFIFVLDALKRQILQFDFKSNFLRDFKIKNHSLKLFMLKGKRLLAYRPQGLKDDAVFPQIQIMDYAGNTLLEKYLPKPFKDQNYLCNSLEYVHENEFRFWQNTADTVFVLTDNGVIEPRHFFYDKEMLPLEYRARIDLLDKYSPEYLEIRSVFETNSLMVFDAVYKNRRRALVYDKRMKTMNNLIYKDRLYDHGFINDIDGGMPFWPYGQADKQHLYTILSPWIFKKIVEDEYTRSIAYKDQKRHDEMVALTQNIEEYDNPIIQLVKMK